MALDHRHESASALCPYWLSQMWKFGFYKWSFGTPARVGDMSLSLAIASFPMLRLLLSRAYKEWLKLSYIDIGTFWWGCESRTRVIVKDRTTGILYSCESKANNNITNNTTNKQWLTVTRTIIAIDFTLEFHKRMIFWWDLWCPLEFCTHMV